jgi:hypothetical protein
MYRTCLEVQVSRKVATKVSQNIATCDTEDGKSIATLISEIFRNFQEFLRRITGAFLKVTEQGNAETMPKRCHGINSPPPWMLQAMLQALTPKRTPGISEGSPTSAESANLPT